MLRRSDRYILREMVGPFALALAGLILFILLNIILSLSDLMVDRGISMPMLLRLVLLKVPSLLVVAIPMSVLFATFLGLGRMVHDREIVALESLGMSLRRILLPLVIAAAGVAVVDFAVYNWLVPSSEAAYQDALRGVIFRQGVPRITSNAFFKGANEQFVYIRRYDESTGKIYDVNIYDTTGRVFPQAASDAPAQLTLLTADQGTWTGDAWSLENAHAYGFDREGKLLFSAVVATLVLPIDQGIAELLSRSRTTAEMGIRELLERVEQARANGQRPDEYLVEVHLKMALPVAAVIFVLLAGSLSLAFLPRSRAVGIVLGLLFVAVFQGVLWWTQTLGRRHAMDPVLAAWLPDILFGAFGLLLFARVDRLASRDVWSRVRARIPFATLALAALVACAPATRGATPVHIDCDELYVSDDGKLIRARGAVRATLEATSIEAGSLVLEQTEPDRWTLAAADGVSLRAGDTLRLESQTLSARVDADTGALVASSAEASTLAGSTTFTNSAGEPATLYFRADRARLTLKDGEVDLIEGYAGELTTCACCGVDLRAQPYSLRADRLLLYPDRLFVAYGITGRAAGVPVVWLPLYLQPLKDTLDAPLFPAIGRSATHGGYAKWSLPFFASPTLYGTLNVDLYPWTREFALGGTVRYDLAGQQGDLTAFWFPAKVTDPETSVRLRHSAALAADWTATGSLDARRLGTQERTSYAFRLDGETKSGTLSVAAQRALTTQEDEATRVEERVPEVSFDGRAFTSAGLTVQPTASAGWRREGVIGQPLVEALRLAVGLSASAATFRVGAAELRPAVALRGALYDGPTGRDEQAVLSLTPTAWIGDLSLAWASAWVFGSSPLDSDLARAEHGLRWSYSRRGPLAVTLDGGFDLARGLGPERVSLAWTALAEWKLAGTLDPQQGRVTALDLSAAWADEAHRVSWLLPLDKTTRRFEQTTLRLGATLDPVSLDLEIVTDLNPLAVSRWVVDTELTSPRGWGLNARLTHTAGRAQPLAAEVGLFRDLGDCLRVGVEVSRSETWLYVSILAFPEAILRYAPRTAEVEVGA